MTLTETERSRYARHLMLPQIGEEGQARLKAGSVAIVGAGGLGSPVALYLAAAGVGRLGLIDFDVVDATNLHRQILYGTSDVGAKKLDAAERRLRDVNPEIEIIRHETSLRSDNALDILGGYDIVIDGTDNFPTRYLVNDACVLLGRPNVYGSIFRFDGQASVFFAKEGPCYRCIYPEPPPPHLVPSCAEGGVLGVLPGVVGTIQATEAIKLLTGAGEPLIGKLLLFDALTMSFRRMNLKKDPNCAVCGPNPTVTKLIDYEGFCNPIMNDEMTPAELARELGNVVLIDIREPYEWQVSHLENAVHMPMRTIPHSLDQIPRDREVVLYCRSGARSYNALQYLKANGFTRVHHLHGGLQAWKRDQDPAIPVA
jgi:adenylyltransferase/sulfurtransferase